MSEITKDKLIALVMKCAEDPEMVYKYKGSYDYTGIKTESFYEGNVESVSYYRKDNGDYVSLTNKKYTFNKIAFDPEKVNFGCISIKFEKEPPIYISTTSETISETEITAKYGLFKRDVVLIARHYRYYPYIICGEYKFTLTFDEFKAISDFIKENGEYRRKSAQDNEILGRFQKYGVT